MHKVYNFPYDNILTDKTDSINVGYWKKKIEQILMNQERNVYKALTLSDNDHEGIDSAHCFYLEGVTQDVLQIINSIKKDLPGCDVKHEKKDYVKDQSRVEKVSRFQTWIIITKNMQKKVNQKEIREKWMKGKPCNFCMLIILIVILFLLITGLYQHWYGYKEPWKNLIAFVKL